MTTTLTHRREAIRVYSSGGVWRLSQALTHLLDRDLKQVIDERLFGPIGIPPHRWDWTPGRTLFERKDWYADAPGYGDFVDPPYEIGGHVVRGGPGWVVISALDLVRFGHLVATGGAWEGERLMGPEWLRGHHGGDSNQVGGESHSFHRVGPGRNAGYRAPAARRPVCWPGAELGRRWGRQYDCGNDDED